MVYKEKRNHHTGSPLEFDSLPSVFDVAPATTDSSSRVWVPSRVALCTLKDPPTLEKVKARKENHKQETLQIELINRPQGREKFLEPNLLRRWGDFLVKTDRVQTASLPSLLWWHTFTKWSIMMQWWNSEITTSWSIFCIIVVIMQCLATPSVRYIFPQLVIKNMC